ncbi:Uncharacterized protein OBRU01_07022 [Operophtera brumata]|uniref:Transmembrane protein 126A n=1 Tax=Operophtera brumata TaxID=104452 RepID=A0A0L7LJJ4_OPEBR|nr:Uncharacterized protein OBRU01_07022 [Operophtera brumata]
MALMKSTVVPDDAVSMTEMEATKYVWDLVGEWNSLSDTWALRYGSIFLGGLNALSGVIINRHYRNKLKLGTYGYISSVVPITVMPAMLTALFHRHLGMGIGYPMVLGPASALLFANRYSTFRVPQLNEGPKKMFKFLQKITKPFNGSLAVIMVAQFIASSAVTYFEMKNNFSLRNKMLAIEEKVFGEHELKNR